MKYRKLGNTDVEVSEICLGTMTWGEQNTEAQAHQQLDYAIGQGINFVDTAEIYPVPTSSKTYHRTEMYIGNWLAEQQRDKLILATKVAGRSNMRYLRGGQETRLTRDQILAACEGSLKRLQTDYIDLYQLHWPERSTNFFSKLNYEHKEETDLTPMEETLSALDDLVKSGKVRYVGLSNETAWGAMRFLHLAEMQNLPRMVSVQNPYNLLCRGYEVGLAEVAMRESCGLLAYSPLAFGVLTGKYLAGNQPDGARLTRWGAQFLRYQTEAGKRATQEYVALAREHNLDPAQMALAYLLTKPFVTSLIIGATTMEQLQSDIEAGDLQLDTKILDAIEQLSVKYSNPCP